MKRFAVIPAGGSGKRFGSDTPKQFLKIAGKEIILYTLEPFLRCEKIDEIIVAVSESYLEFADNLFEQYRKIKPIKVVEGGKERQDSVFAALSFIKNAEPTDFIAVHDAARALLSKDVLEQALLDAARRGSAVVSIPARDTLAIAEAERVIDYANRSMIYYVQTPQIFQYGVLMNALRKAKEENFLGTDESSVVKKYGGDVFLSEGSPLNFKITHKEDLQLAEIILLSLNNEN